MTNQSFHPDNNADGFLRCKPRASRYDGLDDDPYEAPALIAGLIPPGARVLDVGCGTGALSRFVSSSRNASVVGVEPDSERAGLARTQGIEVINGVLTPEVVAQAGHFDVVLFADVLEHVPDPSRLLLTGCRALKENGAVIVSVPNVAHWSLRWNLLRGRFNYEEYGLMDATHLRWFTRDTLTLWLENNGMRVDAVRQSIGAGLPSYAGFPWNVLSAWRRKVVLNKCANAWPGMFGYQHIVRALPTGAGLGTIEQRQGNLI